MLAFKQKFHTADQGGRHYIQESGRNCSRRQTGISTLKAERQALRESSQDNEFRQAGRH